MFIHCFLLCLELKAWLLTNWIFSFFPSSWISAEFSVACLLWKLYKMMKLGLLKTFCFLVLKYSVVVKHLLEMECLVLDQHQKYIWRIDLCMHLKKALTSRFFASIDNVLAVYIISLCFFKQQQWNTTVCFYLLPTSTSSYKSSITSHLSPFAMSKLFSQIQTI